MSACAYHVGDPNWIAWVSPHLERHKKAIRISGPRSCFMVWGFTVLQTNPINLDYIFFFLPNIINPPENGEIVVVEAN